MSKLSIEKFNNYISENNFTLCGIYTLKGNIRFFEMKTPNTRKTFFIHVPENYVVTEENTVIRQGVRIFDMARKYYNFSEEYLRYINSSLVSEFDLVTISSTMLCHIPEYDQSNVSAFSFDLGDDSSSYESGTSSSQSSSSSSKSSTKKHTSQIEQLIKESGVPDKEFLSSDDGKSDAIDALPIQLDAKSDGDKSDGDIPEEVKSDDESTETQSSVDIKFDFPPKEYKDKSPVDSEDAATIKYKRILTDIPEHIEQQQIRLGLVYYCCNISHFVAKINLIEVEVEKCWKASDEIRRTEWERSLEHIKDRIEKLKENLVKRVTKHIERYVTTQDNISKLSVLYIKSNDDVSNPTKEEFRKKTKTMLDEVGVTLIHHRNEIENEIIQVEALLDENEDVFMNEIKE